MPVGRFINGRFVEGKFVNGRFIPNEDAAGGSDVATEPGFPFTSGVPEGMFPTNVAEENPATTRVLKGALFGTPLGRAGMVGGGLAGLISEPDPGIDIGGSTAERLALQALGPKGRLASAASTPLRRMLFRGAATGAGAALGEGVENLVLGEKIDPSSLAYIAAVTGTFSTAADALGHQITKISAAPHRPIKRALNSLDKKPDEIKFTLGTKERLSRPRLADFLSTTPAAERTVDEFQRYLDDVFPVELTQRDAETLLAGLDEALGTARKGIRRDLAKKTLQARLTDSGASADDLARIETLTESGLLRELGPDDLGLVRAETAEVFNHEFGDLTTAEAGAQFTQLHRLNAFEPFLRRVFGSASDPASASLANLKALKKITDAMEQPEIFDKLANEWIRRELIGKATIRSAVAGKGLKLTADEIDGTAILNGRTFARHIADVGVEKINEVFGPKRGQALLDIARAMELMDPSRSIQASTGPMDTIGGYMGKRAAFTFVLGSIGGISGGAALQSLGGAAAGAAGAAGVVGVSLGVARLAQAALANPAVAKSLVRSIENANGAGLSAFLRGIVSQESDEPSRAAPPLSPRSLFQ